MVESATGFKPPATLSTPETVDGGYMSSAPPLPHPRPLVSKDILKVTPYQSSSELRATRHSVLSPVSVVRLKSSVSHSQPVIMQRLALSKPVAKMPSNLSRLSQMVLGSGGASPLSSSLVSASTRSPSSGDDAPGLVSPLSRPKRITSIDVRGSMIGQLMLHYSLFVLLCLLGIPLQLTHNMRFYALYIYFNITIYVVQLSRILYFLNDQSMVPFYISLIPFGLLCTLSRELRKFVTVLWYASFIITYMQFGKIHMVQHLFGYSFGLAVVYATSICYMIAVYKQVCNHEFICGPPLDRDIVLSEEILFIVACMILGVTFITLQHFVQRNALTLMEREDYVKNLMTTNADLRRELRKINIDKDMDFETPMSKVIQILKDIRQLGQTDSSTNQSLDFVVKVLTSNDLFAPDLTAKSGDGDVQDFVNKLLQKNTRTTPQTTKQRSSPPSTNPRVIELNHSIENNHEVQAYNTTVLTLSQDVLPSDILKQTNPNFEALIAACFANFETPSFDIFALDALTSGHPLYYIGLRVFQQHSLLDAFHIHYNVLQHFLLKIESGYLAANPYHNATHAADVTTAMHFYLSRQKLIGALPPEDLLAALLAAIIHDFGHPGYNNNFLINIGDRLALQYNDVSVLEHYHCSAAFGIMQESKLYNILANISPELHKNIRETVVSLVLATDMANHFELVSKFKNRILSGSDMDFEQRADRKMLLGMAIKCADVNNPTKPQDQSIRWTNLIMEEFFLQGDEEQRRGLEISVFMNRHTTDIPKCQVVISGFIDFVVIPLYEAWYMFMKEEIQVLMDNMNSNKVYWKTQPERSTTQPTTMARSDDTVTSIKPQRSTGTLHRPSRAEPVLSTVYSQQTSPIKPESPTETSPLIASTPSMISGLVIFNAGQQAALSPPQSHNTSDFIEPHDTV